MNFKIKHNYTTVYWNYYSENPVPHFLKHIKSDILSTVGCHGFNDSYITVKDQTIKSKLIKTLFDM